MITTIGCCDSGLGGMLVVKALKEAYPDLNIVFIADQSNVPYGEKSVEDLSRYARAFLDRFRKMEIHEVVIACNTLCANVIGDIQEEYEDLHIFNIIEPTCRQLAGHGYQKINVLATPKTVERHAYQKALGIFCPEAEVHEIPAAKLVPVIEDGCDPLLLKKAVEGYVTEKADAWVLGCTHFPLIRPYLEGKGEIFDSNQAIVDLFKDEQINGEGRVEIYTTKDPDKMKKSIQTLLKCEYDVKAITLDS